MSFGPAFHLVGALKSAVTTLPTLWRQAWLALLVLFGLVLISQLPQIGLGTRRALIVASLLFQFVVAGGLYRVALFGERYAKPEGLGFGGVQFGKPEARLIGAGLLAGLFWLMVFATLCVVLALFLGAAGLADQSHNTPHGFFLELVNGPQPQGVVLLVAIAGVMLTLTILSVKLWLHQAATVAEHRVVSLNALTLSSGQTVKLFLGYLYLALPFIVLSAVIPTAGNLSLIVNLALGVGVFLPVSIAFLASAYRQIMDLRAKG
ncbi:hypothetical protein PQU92_13470 [Asticcacaulis sp. BYS171W]|uniref:Glycerophosphoryl diester phosphodiesterase membrane domain-containing protein n=1 Tax=Asticcacaulis aquaticus TaxID=2984212 RepID=A0ABT5HWI2_9CAUL|nr:hypothetical protein [Asticcacaulis aquaticus]MDC7684293.1 hypothetical protein [Asticcacaulis aquaticus]